MKCRVLGTQQLVAIKRFKVEDTDGDAAALRACAWREVQLLRQLRHASVVTYIEVPSR